MHKVIIAALLLTGCSLTNPVIVETPPVYHPNLPTPYTACNAVSWEVLVYENKPIVTISYSDNITAAICAKDMERYLSQLKTVVCHYRQDLKEEACKEPQ